MADAELLTQWLAGEVCEVERRPELVRYELLGRCRAERIEPPAAGRIDRIVRSALHQAEQDLTARLVARLSVCDLYLTCAKFVTTADCAPRLRARREVEQTLALDAADRGWAREVERHRCTANRIERLLTDLGETLDEPILDTSADVD